ncbi:phospholipase D-like domain-containing protein [Thauera aromatica]|uniref:phospholipase D-like domain-containing protein n=1 Tax=Thauera aromatica TaxID=59405 RepID=UPI001FFCDD44|nr:phospholipase D-like domain-containing protein [Thauera aromatica]MCK2097755.1 phospholipase D-like domain-containing protein [Thauera aromatica]
MELKAHFSNIHKVIIDHLEQARSDIVAAIAWFTDRDIFEVLCKKARSGIKVSVALIGDEINQGPGGLNFQRLRNLGGQVTFLPPGSHDAPTMHHKFCVIDRATVITGSYNWSQKARSNDENITVVTGATDFAGKYLDTFDSLLDRTGHGAPVVADADAARRRLEMIRNLILLGEQDDVASHVRKLRPVADVLQVSRIVVALENGEYRAALEEIDAYLRRATAVVAAGYADIPRLRFQLESLELRLESLSDEKAELERRLITFNRRHDDALGDLIQRLLKARAELARLLAAERDNDKERIEGEAAAREAESAYQDYSTQHEELQNAEPLPKLDEEAERELKALYRKACSLCHPDKVAEEKKEAAHSAFVELQEAYKGNDLARVREIHAALAAGGLPATRSTTLSEVEALKAAIAELEYAIARLVAELKAVQESDGVRLMDAAGATEADWQRFFERQRDTLEMELARIVSDIQAEQTEEIGFP